MSSAGFAEAAARSSAGVFRGGLRVGSSEYNSFEVGNLGDHVEARMTANLVVTTTGHADAASVSMATNTKRWISRG